MSKLDSEPIHPNGEDVSIGWIGSRRSEISHQVWTSRCPGATGCWMAEGNAILPTSCIPPSILRHKRSVLRPRHVPQRVEGFQQRLHVRPAGSGCGRSSRSHSSLRKSCWLPCSEAPEALQRSMKSSTVMKNEGRTGNAEGTRTIGSGRRSPTASSEPLRAG